jgi:hypothetical protein
LSIFLDKNPVLALPPAIVFWMKKRGVFFHKLLSNDGKRTLLKMVAENRKIKT